MDMQIFKSIFFKIVSNPKVDSCLIWLKGLIEKSLNYGNGGEYNLSGELQVVKRIFGNYSVNSVVFFDVGANNGNYAKQVIAILANKLNHYYCFEPSEATRDTLINNISAIQRVSVYPYALSDVSEEKLLLSSSQSSGLSTFYERDISYHHIEYDSSELVQAITLDEFCSTIKIDFIDFLKMDIEGHELSALRGAKKLIEQRKIRFIQFEFGGCNIDSRTFLKDFYLILSKNYDLYRIQRYSIIKMPSYGEHLENFTTTNYIAILKN
jgi:FkbM family methyltransferase